VNPKRELLSELQKEGAICPACTSARSRSLGEFAAKLDRSFSAEVYCCRSCGSKFTWPMILPGELNRFYSAIFEGGAGQALGENSAAKKRMAQVLLSEVERWLPTGGGTLDIGAGFGEWLELLHNAGLYDSYCGVEYSGSMVQELRERCPWVDIFPSLAGLGRLVRSNRVKNVGFRLYTGIDVIVGEKGGEGDLCYFIRVVQ
jgi:hypothetical protein